MPLEGCTLDRRRHLCHEPRDSRNFGGSLAPSHDRPGSVRENAIERRHPRPSGAEAKRARAGSVGGDHATDRAECSAGRVDWKAESNRTCRGVDAVPDRAGSDDDTLALPVRGPDSVEAAEVDDDATTNRAAGHAAA